MRTPTLKSSLGVALLVEILKEFLYLGKIGNYWGNLSKKKPYLTYNIKVESSKLNIPKLSKKQMSLFKKICELRNQGMNFQQISDKLNELGYAPKRGKVGEFNNRKVWSNYMKIKKNLARNDIYHPPDLDDVELVWE